MKLNLFQVDAFTKERFSGNPAAVCLLEGPAPDEWMQKMGLEMNLSETAFLYPEGNSYHLRWFTPQVEVALCGHATLASSHILWEEGLVPQKSSISFQTRSGELKAKREADLIWLDFPSLPETRSLAPEGLCEALGVTPSYVGKSRFDFLVEVASEAEVRALRPDFARLRAVDCRAVIVTSRAEGKDYDFVSRVFAPGSGIDEDPVTGSAHCALAPFWSSRLGKTRLTAHQASRRGGTVLVESRGERVALGGHAVTVLRGALAAVPA